MRFTLLQIYLSVTSLYLLCNFDSIWWPVPNPWTKLQEQEKEHDLFFASFDCRHKTNWTHKNRINKTKHSMSGKNASVSAFYILVHFSNILYKTTKTNDQISVEHMKKWPLTQIWWWISAEELTCNRSTAANSVVILKYLVYTAQTCTVLPHWVSHTTLQPSG